MKIQIMSDLHIGIKGNHFDPPQTDSDVVVLAGDTLEGCNGIEWASKAFPHKKVIYIAGNHEFYNKKLPSFHKKLKAAAERTPNVIFLENESIQIGNVKFYGCTLWTDFNLFGQPNISYVESEEVMNDFKVITSSKTYKTLRAYQVYSIHKESCIWLKKSLEDDSNSVKKVVITHHAPSAKSLREFWEYKRHNAAYASHMDDFIMDTKPDLWIHGHVHIHSDYKIGDTRVVANPRGYPHQETYFKPDFSVEF